MSLLRQNHRHHENIHLTADSELVFDDVRGDCIELAVEVDLAEAGEFGVKVRCSPEGGRTDRHCVQSERKDIGHKH